MSEDAFREVDGISEEDRVTVGLTRTDEDRQMFLANNKALIEILIRKAQKGDDRMFILDEENE